MKKILSLMVLALFLISLMPIGFAQLGVKKTAPMTVNNPARTQEQIQEHIDESAETIVIAPATQANKETIRERFEERKVANIEKLTNLDPEKTRRLQSLSNVNLEKIAGLNKENIEKISKLSRAKQKELVGLDKEDIQKRLEKIRVRTVNKAEDMKLRVLTRQRVEAAKNNFEKARERYENAKGKYDDAKQKYLAAKEAGDEEATLEHAKEVLLESAESILSHLEKIKSKIEENENIGEEEAQDLINRIDAKIAEIEDTKATIEAATTKDEIREAAKALNANWKNTQQKAKAFAERVVAARVQGVVNQGLVLEKKLDHALAKMEEKGIEVDVDSEIEAFSSLIAIAKEKFEQAQEKLEQARDATDKETTKSLTDEAKSLIDKSRDSIKEAHEKLNEIIKKFREAGQELEIDEEAEVEVEDEEDSEDEVDDEDESEIDSKYYSDEKYCKKDSDCTLRDSCCNSCYKDYVNIYNKESIPTDQCKIEACVQDCPDPSSFKQAVCREKQCVPIEST